MMKRIILLILVLSILSLTFISCDSTETAVETTANKDSITETAPDKPETEPEFVPEIEKKDYGEDFFLSIQPNSNHVDYYWVEDVGTDPMSEAVYSRQQKIREHIGVNIIGTQTKGHDQYGEPFKIAVKTADGSVDSLLSHSYMYLSQFIKEGYLTDYNNMPIIDLEADYWNKAVMEEVAVGDKLYLGYSDFRLVHTHAIAFNKVMLAQVSGYLEETPYEMVDNYRWTLDKMLSLASLVSKDTTGDGKSEDDVFGITGKQWVPFINFLPACNIPLVASDVEGNYTVTVYNEENKEKTVNIVNKLLELSKSDNAWFKYKEESTPMISITTDRTLMYICATNELPSFINYEIEFGVLPYPMYDENQKSVGYRSLDWGGWICIPSFMKNQELTAETLELLAYYSDEVTVTFYEKLLGKQVADVPDDRRMLDVIWDSVCSDVGLTYSHIDLSLDYNLYMLPTLTHANASEGVASYVDRYQKTANRHLRKFFKDINK